jgi:hypothetical protein
MKETGTSGFINRQPQALQNLAGASLGWGCALCSVLWVLLCNAVRNAMQEAVQLMPQCNTSTSTSTSKQYPIAMAKWHFGAALPYWRAARLFGFEWQCVGAAAGSRGPRKGEKRKTPDARSPLATVVLGSRWFAGWRAGCCALRARSFNSLLRFLGLGSS